MSTSLSSMRRVLLSACLLCVSVIAASAQTIAGVVKDSSGGVLPGVTVEASSPALIEKARTAITDDQGQYRITNLVPGVYSVTFTLQSFTTLKRDGIEISDGFTAPVNAEMAIGVASETVTVTGATPIVDVQGLGQIAVMSRTVMDSIPNGRNPQALGILIPGTTLQGAGGGVISRDVGGSGNIMQSPLTYHGSTNTVANIDGVRNNDIEASGQYTNLFNDGSFQEISYTTGADSAEMVSGGLRINMIPKEGGNTFRGTIFGNWSPESGIADNCRAPAQFQPCEKSELVGRGIFDVAKVRKIYDFNPSVGGPILKDRLWWQGTFRRQVINKTVVDSYFDADPTPYKYTADLTRQGVDDGFTDSKTIRLATQLTPKNKITWYLDLNRQQRPYWGGNATTMPEGSGQLDTHQHSMTLKYQSTLGSKLLFEAAWGQYDANWGELYQPEVCAPSNEVTPDDPRSCQRSTIYRINDQNTTKNYGAFNRETFFDTLLNNYSAKLSYVTGAHNLQGGWTGVSGRRLYTENHTGDLNMRFGPTVTNADATGFGPNRVTLLLPVDTENGITMDSGFWVNDRWTIKRATLTLGLRYDWFVGYIGDSSITENRWAPARTFTEPQYIRTVPNWRDLSPRVGLAYDLFGNGRTALKVSMSRFVDTQTIGFAEGRNPVNQVTNSINLGWNDHNKDFTIFNPDGSVQDINFNPNAPIDPTTGVAQNELDPKPANSTFGTLVTSTTRVDPAIEKGFGSRGSTWEFDASVQHQVLPGVAVSFMYWRRLLAGNATLTDNVNVGPDAYYGNFCVAGPADSKLPNGGGQTFCGIYQPVPNGGFYTATTDNYTTFRDNYLQDLNYDQFTNYRHGFDINVRARFGPGAMISGGVSFDRTVTDSCYTELLGNPTSIVSPYSGRKACDKAEVAPFRPDLKVLGSYPLPWQLRASATYQYTSGPRQQANWTFTQAVANANGWAISTTPGSSAAAIANAQMTVDVMQGFYQYDKGLQQLDVRMARLMRFNKVRFELQADLYNVFNSAWIFTESNTYGTTTAAGFQPAPANGWLKPTNILNSRAFKIGVQMDW